MKEFIEVEKIEDTNKILNEYRNWFKKKTTKTKEQNYSEYKFSTFK